MLSWAVVVALALGILAYLAGDLATVLTAAAELGTVLALFALICAAEAWN
jgi:hypothetical protein